MSGAIAIAAGQSHTCALLDTGKVMCWGLNNSGQVGNGMVQQVAAQQHEVAGVENAVAIAAAYDHSCALIAGGSVKCWGQDMRGQLGDGKPVIVGSPVSVSGLDDAKSIAAGGASTCVIREDASIRCWGANYAGQLGMPPPLESSDVPVTVDVP